MLTVSFCLAIIAVPITTSAHNANLDVEYDNCVPESYVDSDNIGAGYDELWYKMSPASHIGHNISTIKYYIAPCQELNEEETWEKSIGEEKAAWIKAYIRKGIEKWNDVYFYSYNASGVATRTKLVNIVEGTANDYNVIIYPTGFVYFGHTEGIPQSADDTYVQRHYNQFKMLISLYYFIDGANNYRYNGTERDLSFAEQVKALERVAAHEFGHVLGLRDMDSTSAEDNPHHQEVLMGYAVNQDVLTTQSEITYRDIAGVAITRAFHTDNDHIWLYDANNSTSSQKKLICSICNGVKYVSSLSGYTYSTYKACNSVHTASSGNLIPVASDASGDFYKCKHCRYVADRERTPVTDYFTYIYNNSSTHAIASQVGDVTYIGGCENHTDTYSARLGSTTHTAYCRVCNTSRNEIHVAAKTDKETLKTCTKCGIKFDPNGGVSQIEKKQDELE